MIEPVLFQPQQYKSAHFFIVSLWQHDIFLQRDRRKEQNTARNSLQFTLKCSPHFDLHSFASPQALQNMHGFLIPECLIFPRCLAVLAENYHWKGEQEERESGQSQAQTQAERMDWEWDLGMFVDELSMAQQCLPVTQKASSTLGCTQGWPAGRGRGFSSCSLYLCAALEPSPQEGCESSGLNPEEGHKNAQKGIRWKEGSL